LEDQLLNLLIRDWLASKGASETAIKKLCHAAPRPLPESYLSLLSLTNGGEGPLAVQPFYLQLDTAETVTDTAITKRHKENFPGFFIIGSNGGGEYIAFDFREHGSMPIVAIDMTNINLKESILTIAPDFDVFIEQIGIEAEI
jgi:SMI1 / KNR4 family (SUKH-1)